MHGASSLTGYTQDMRGGSHGTALRNARRIAPRFVSAEVWRFMMKAIWWLVLWPGILALVAIVLVVALLLVKLLWAWTIPDLFPGAVAQGLVAGSISWFTSFKVALFVAVMAGLSGLGRGSKS